MKISCDECGAEIPSDSCPACKEPAPLWARFCPFCGKKLAREQASAYKKGRRQLCPDESCIGIIGPDGVCTDCGRRA
jgi:predicted amidophosphoribosyltransferase